LSVVLDASVTMAWYFEDESTPTTDALLDRIAERGAVVPAHWRLEVASAFQVAVRCQRIDAIYRDASLAELGLLPITIDADTNTYAWLATVRLAERFALSVYDATYLELAHRHSLPLATLNIPLLGTA